MTDSWLGVVLGLALAWARLLPAALALPLLGGAGGWLGLCMLLAITPLLAPPAASIPASLPLALTLELAIGVGFALALAAPLVGVRWAGRWLEAAWMGAARGTSTASAGLGGAVAAAGGVGGAVQSLFVFGTLALFVSMGGLRLWSRVWLDASLVPIDPQLGAVALASALAGSVGGFVGQILLLALSLAAPAWACLVALDLGLAAASRVAGTGASALLGLSVPLRLLSLALPIPLLWDALPEWFRLASRVAQGFVRSLGA